MRFRCVFSVPTLFIIILQIAAHAVVVHIILGIQRVGSIDQNNR